MHFDLHSVGEIQSSTVHYFFSLSGAFTSVNGSGPEHLASHIYYFLHLYCQKMYRLQE